MLHNVVFMTLVYSLYTYDVLFFILNYANLNKMIEIFHISFNYIDFSSYIYSKDTHVVFKTF